MNNMTANSMRLDEKRGRMTARVDLELGFIVECSSVKSRFNGSERSRVRGEGERAMFGGKGFLYPLYFSKLGHSNENAKLSGQRTRKKLWRGAHWHGKMRKIFPFSHHSKPLLRPSSVVPALKIGLFI